MKKMPVVFVILFSVLCLPPPVISQSSQSLDWQIQFLRGSALESVPLDDAIKMGKNSEFNLAIKADSTSYCYVIFYDDDRQFHVLHNQALRAGVELRTGGYINEPSRRQTVYVIMSLSRQTDLERMITAHGRNPDSRQNNNNLFNEIAKLQKDSSPWEQDGPNITRAGGNRSGNTAIESGNTSQIPATKFSGKDFYVLLIDVDP